MVRVLREVKAWAQPLSCLFIRIMSTCIPAKIGQRQIYHNFLDTYEGSGIINKPDKTGVLSNEVLGRRRRVVVSFHAAVHCLATLVGAAGVHSFQQLFVWHNTC